MPLDMHVRQLRFLDSGEIRQIGGRGLKCVDVRVIADLNRGLTTRVREKLCCTDLCFRRRVVVLHEPPLRERQEDIEPLVCFLINAVSLRLNLLSPELTDTAMSMLPQC